MGHSPTHAAHDGTGTCHHSTNLVLKHGSEKEGPENFSDPFSYRRLCFKRERDREVIKNSLRGNRIYPAATLRDFFFFTTSMLFRSIKKQKYIHISICMQIYTKQESYESLILPFFFF